MPLAKLFLLEFAKDITIAQCAQNKMDPKSISNYFTEVAGKLQEAVYKVMDSSELQAAMEDRMRLRGMDQKLGDLPDNIVGLLDGLPSDSSPSKETPPDSSPSKETPSEEYIIRDGKQVPGIRCLVCNELMEAITASHLALHGMDFKKYRAQFDLPNDPLTGKNMKHLRQFPAYAGESAVGSPAVSKEVVMKSLEGDPDRITCLICNKKCGILTKKHLLSHGLTPEEYCKMFGLAVGTPLCSTNVRAMRSKAMGEHKIWKKRK